MPDNDFLLFIHDYILPLYVEDDLPYNISLSGIAFRYSRSPGSGCWYWYARAWVSGLGQVRSYYCGTYLSADKVAAAVRHFDELRAIHNLHKPTAFSSRLHSPAPHPGLPVSR